MITSTFICSKCGNSSYDQFSQTQVRCLSCGSVETFDTGYKPIQEFQFSTDNDILDFKKEEVIIPASLVKRFINYLIDVIFIVAVSLGGIYFLFGIETLDNLEENNFTLFVYLIFFLYYMIMEYSFGKTIGKFITRTKVISTDSERLSLGQCAGRAISRFIPFDGISCFFGGNTCWHDTIPKTMAVDDTQNIL